MRFRSSTGTATWCSRFLAITMKTGYGMVKPTEGSGVPTCQKKLISIRYDWVMAGRPLPDLLSSREDEKDACSYCHPVIDRAARISTATGNLFSIYVQWVGHQSCLCRQS